MTEDEQKLINDLNNAQTQTAAFNQLVNMYKERLYWHIRKIVISHDDTDDVLQNTFIKVYKNVKGFKGDSKLYTWMYRIATNEAITFLNKKAKRKDISVENIKKI